MNKSYPDFWRDLDGLKGLRRHSCDVLAELLKLSVGVSASPTAPAIGVTMDGVPAGERIDLAELQGFLDRRRAGRRRVLATARKEADAAGIPLRAAWA